MGRIENIETAIEQLQRMISHAPENTGSHEVREWKNEISRLESELRTLTAGDVETEYADVNELP